MPHKIYIELTKQFSRQWHLKKNSTSLLVMKNVLLKLVMCFPALTVPYISPATPYTVSTQPILLNAPRVLTFSFLLPIQRHYPAYDWFLLSSQLIFRSNLYARTQNHLLFTAELCHSVFHKCCMRLTSFADRATMTHLRACT